MYRKVFCPTVQAVLADFEQDSAKAEIVTRKHIDDMLDFRENKVESRSSWSVHVSKALSADSDAASESQP